MNTEFHSEHQKRIDHLEDLDVGGRLMLKQILEKGHEFVDWVRPFQNSDQWCVLVNTIMKLQVP
jgi:hypothetical protein